MSESFKKHSTAARYRDLFRRIAVSEIDKALPHDELGTVVSVDPVKKTAEVSLPGSTGTRAISYGFGAVPSVGDAIRITGRATSRYIVSTGSGTGGGGSVPGVPPTVVLAAVGAGVHAVGDTSVTSVALTATLTVGTNPITALRFYRDGILIQLVTSPTSPVTYTDATAVTTTTVYTVQIDAGGSTITGNTQRFDFVNPYYYGLSATDALGTGVTALASDLAIESTRSYVYTLTSTPQYIYFAMPHSYAPIVVIRDRLTGLEYSTGGFKTIATVTISGVSYDVYQSKRQQSSAVAAIYYLDFSASVDVATTGSSLLDASQLLADPSGDLMTLNVQAQLYELDDRSSAYAKLHSMDTIAVEFDDFMGGVVGTDPSIFNSQLGWHANLVNGGVLTPALGPDDNSLGWVNPVVGSGDSVSMYRHHTAMDGRPPFLVAWRISVPILNNGTDDIKIRFGLIQSITALDSTDGYYWEYIPGQTTWHLKTAQASVRTDIDTGITVDTNYHWFIIECDGAPDSPTVRGWIAGSTAKSGWNPNGSPDAIISDGTTIPAPGGNYGPGCTINKAAGTLGRGIRISKYYLRVEHQ